MDLRKMAALKVMEILEDQGYQAYLVGGCVRDECLGRSPQDYDVTTNAVPEQVMAIFEKVIPTGLRHGTVTVIEHQVPIEVTTFRKEESYKNHRQPERVRFIGSLREDLARRDFTINAMAKDRHGNLIDYFSGQEDLRNGIIRTVGLPAERFQEDALRMLRAVRFANQFGFRLDAATMQGISSHKKLGVYLSVERVTAELEKMFKSEKVCLGLQLLFRTGLIFFLPPFCHWGLSETLKNQEINYKADKIPNLNARWAYLLELCAASEKDVSPRLDDLKLPKRAKQQIARCFLLARQLVAPPSCQSDEDWCRLLLRHGLETVIEARHLAGLIAEKLVVPSECQFSMWWHKMPVHHSGQLNINGHDLMQYCRRPKGAWIGKVLYNLFEQVALGKIPNDKVILLKEGCKLGALDKK
ncbi:CCA tRNA nucleotidyltransferase [Thermoactinomyces mirandus]|uniref:CCA tRNA nucleotidyltransferase n=1 Tax=Thermoactinomyces mirandus TaxID=2756294 RepID=A0A7W1XSY4_9BACL|nr:CCA tRNA nucleotidyltransferase [Thermoactinomyces mirandus]MBA4602576.1 CCA tRNA nucleotidyltransferase [Thermoactinomyces mirandus]